MSHAERRTTDDSQSGPLLKLRPEDYPDVSHLITEDGAPVDSIYVEKQYRLLTDPLENCWVRPGKRGPLVALTNVGLFFEARNPPLVPDFLLSLDVGYVRDPQEKEGQSYFVWLFGKPPDLVGEIVSDRRGGEASRKLRQYARLGIRYYFIYDPRNLLRDGTLRTYGLHPQGYEPIEDHWLGAIGLGLTLWQGTYSGYDTEWLRFCDRNGRVIPTSAEHARQAKRRADQQKRRADEQQRRADEQQRRADEQDERAKRLEAQLRAAGIEPSA
jgi:hypothetical protein